jgi:hypothetical protein
MSNVVDLRVGTVNPDYLDQTLSLLPGPPARVVAGSFDGTACTVRVFGDPDFLKFALKNQGYGTLLSEEQEGDDPKFENPKPAPTEGEILEMARQRYQEDAEFHARAYAAATVVASVKVGENQSLRDFMPRIFPVLTETAAVALVLAEEQLPT